MVYYNHRQISTHTLTWSVTTGIYDGNIIACISTHTLTWSVTHKVCWGRARETISTHTLTWSVTLWRWWLQRNSENFNSHAHVERDGSGSYRRGQFWGFQLTRSRGAWQPHGLHSFPCQDFNSHAHVERDSTSVTFFSVSVISTHTLTWSVTGDEKIVHELKIFQLTRSRGAWL